jgi:hypothetical protein
MADTPAFRQEPATHKGRLRPPSEGIRAWTVYWMEFADWFIDARKRWHEGDPQSKAHRWRRVLGSGATVVAAAAIIERLAGG